MNDDARRRAEDFVREVEAAMVDISPARRAGLTADLADHLLEPGDDGTRLIDQGLDPRTYADELRAAAGAPPASRLMTPALRNRGRTALLVGAALLVLVLAASLVAAVAGPWILSAWRVESTQPPTAEPTPGPELIYVPDVIGMPQPEALKALEDMGLTVIAIIEGRPDEAAYVPSDTVIEMDPARGSAVPPGTAVLIVVTP